MKSFHVEIIETLHRTVTVEASDEREAYDKVREAWRRCEYVLNPDDFFEAGFEVLSLANSNLPDDGLV